MQTMSFLEALKRKKTGLISTNTVVKTPGGDVFLERKNEDGEVNVEKIASAEGYVVDLKPDLQVAKVLPGLTMGSQDVTQDVSLLKKYNITDILSLGVKVNPVPGVKYTFIDVLDLPETNMKTVIDQSVSVIDAVQLSGGVVYVHCNAGVSRSATIVIAYLMITKRLRYQEAFHKLKQVRPCIKPNEGFVKQLQNLEQLIHPK